MGPEGRAPIVGDDSRAAAPEKVYSGNSDLRDNAVQFQGNVKGPVTINQGPGKPNAQFLRDFGVTDPRDVKSRIEASKDDLLEGSCSWVIHDAAFQKWWGCDDTYLLWIHGDAGKGKTMMAMALIAEVSRRLNSKPGSGVLSYFFCQSTHSLLNNAVAVLRGLIYHLVVEDTELQDLLQKKYDETGGSLFDGGNVLYALARILADLSQNTRRSEVYFMIDALDECDTELPELLKEISRKTSSRKVKWLVTSRPRVTIIRGKLKDLVQPEISLETESNSKQVSKAVDAFINWKVSKPADAKCYGEELATVVRQYLSDKADGTFLWAALVCKELEHVDFWKTEDVLRTFPQGLGPLYKRILDQILSTDDENAKICRQILCLVTLAFRPLHLKDIVYLGEIRQGLQSYVPERSRKLVDLCGSFITSREDTISLVHQSAADFFKAGEGSSIFRSEYGPGRGIDVLVAIVTALSSIFHSEYGLSRGIYELVAILTALYYQMIQENDKNQKEWQSRAHSSYAERCLTIMLTNLKKNLCKLLGLDASPCDAAADLLTDNLPSYVQYACHYWVDHLIQASGFDLQTSLLDDGRVHKFLQKHLLHWLEVFSLTGKMSEGILAITSLESYIPADRSPNLYAFVRDGKRFTRYNRSAIEKAPLQIYNSALVFAPEQSIVRKQFEKCINGIYKISKGQANWSGALQTLTGHSDWVWSVAFSPDSKLVASGSGDDTVRLWEAATGAPHGEPLTGHSDWVRSVAFSPDGKLVTVSDWVIKDTEKLLWIPPDYRATCGVVRDGLLVLGHSSGAVSIFRFK